MNTTRLPKKQGKVSLLQLLFLINPVTKEIRFSNQPLGFEVNPKTGIPTFIIFEENSESALLTAEWRNCLLLSPGESREFDATIHNNSGELIPVIFHATGVEMTGDPAHYVLFTVKQTSANDEWKKRFEQLQASLEAYKKEYTVFIDIATHDLDAPLRKLSTFIDRLTKKLSNTSAFEEVQEYIPRIEASLKEMRSLIDDLSALSRIISQKREYSSCNIETIVREIIAGMQPLVKEKKAVFNISGLPVIEGDIEQLKQLFKNLLENAIKFSRKDLAPVITIRSSEINPEETVQLRLRDPGKYVKLEIEDNGIGFKQEFAEKIFQPFQRLHGKSEFPGNGIGLAVCKKIIDNHRGIINAKVGENSGACFILILPQTNL